MGSVRTIGTLRSSGSRVASCSGSDREPSRFSVAPTALGLAVVSSILACSYALRTGTVRGPILSRMQPCSRLTEAFRWSLLGACQRSAPHNPMKALVLKAYKQFAHEDVPAPEAGPAEVVVAVKACGICGSDVHGMDGSTGRRRPPIIMGHEASGVISSLGSDVTGWAAGDRITFDSTIYCGHCEFCRRGLINLCDNRQNSQCPQ